jgi:transcriptional regulator with GAF, ATPase, and Fis domain
MPVRRAWVECSGTCSESLCPEAVEALRAAGVESHPQTRHDAEGPGLFFVDEPSTEACEFVRNASRNGVERVMVIVPSASVLSEGAAWALIAAGASDVFAWDHSASTATEAAARLSRWGTVDDLIASPAVRTKLVGDSPRWRALLRDIVEVARFTDASVLLMGESGTGKELVARLIHDLDPRPRKGELVLLDCTTVVPSLSGSEFFGHERGAFTGAVAAREGAFARADGGTLFLDEVGELSPALQAELLRVVQEGTYKRVGSDTWRHTRFRLVCATNRDVQDGSDSGFRRDLYYRIAGWTFQLPSLRERPEDVMPLFQYFIAEARPDAPLLELDDPVRRLVLSRDYPGNVRDLRRLVLRIAARHVGPGPITIGDVPVEERPDRPRPVGWDNTDFEQVIRRAIALGAPLREITAAAAEAAIGLALDEEDGNLRRAAKRLDVTPRALQLRRARRVKAAKERHDGA